MDLLWAKIAKAGPDECWPWTASTNDRGYGQFRVGGRAGRTYLAHRLVWELLNGDPGELNVLHRCDNPPCCNPAHLWLGTHADNVADMVAKGRANGGARKLTAEAVRSIRERWARGGILQRELASMFGVEQPQISRIVNGKEWTEEVAA